MGSSIRAATDGERSLQPDTEVHTRGSSRKSSQQPRFHLPNLGQLLHTLETMYPASACTPMQCVHNGINASMQILPSCCLQTRAATMTTVMGRFFLGLVWDRVSGQADTPGRVQYRAAQLRCLVGSCSYHHQCCLPLLVSILHSQQSAIAHMHDCVVSQQ